MENEERMVLIPLSQFVDGITAQADLNSVRTLVEYGGEYCSDGIKSVLGLGIITKDDVR